MVSWQNVKKNVASYRYTYLTGDKRRQWSYFYAVHSSHCIYLNDKEST